MRNSTVDLSHVVPVKSTLEILQNGLLRIYELYNKLLYFDGVMNMHMVYQTTKKVKTIWFPPSVPLHWHTTGLEKIPSSNMYLNQ